MVSDKTWHQGAYNRLMVQAQCDAVPEPWRWTVVFKLVLHDHYRRYLCKRLGARLETFSVISAHVPYVFMTPVGSPKMYKVFASTDHVGLVHDRSFNGH